MKRALNLFCILVLVILIIGCKSSTRIQETWSDPSLKNGTVLPFKKVMVIAALDDELNRRYAEDKIASHFKNRIAIPSYKYLGMNDTSQKQTEERMAKDSFDGIVMMRLLRIDEIENKAPAAQSSYWYNIEYSDTVAIVTTDKSYVVTTNFYSLPSNKLLWTGTTASLNPENLDKVLGEIIYTIKSELLRQGLIK